MDLRMHLAVDCVGVNDGGGATVALDFLQAALQDRRIARLTVFSSPLAALSFAYPAAPNLRIIEQPRAYRSRISRVLWQLRQLGTACQQQGADRLLCLANAGEARPGLPHVTFIQQSLPFSPEALATLATRRRVEMLVLRQLMRRSCQRARRVLAQTDVMAGWLAQAFTLPASKLAVIEPVAVLSPPTGPPSPRLAALRAAPPGLRLLYVGSDSPYKQVAILIASLPDLQARLPGLRLFLTLPVAHAYHDLPGVTCLGYLSAAELYEAYQLATVLLMPSLVETVGLPMLEAFSMRVPVVAADRPYAHSVCQNAALFFDPYDVAALSQQVSRVLQDETLRQTLITRGTALLRRRLASDPYQQMVDAVLAGARNTHTASSPVN